jgi:hypothetical protein
MLTSIDFPSFFIQRGRQLDPTSASSRRENVTLVCFPGGNDRLQGAHLWGKVIV